MALKETFFQTEGIGTLRSHLVGPAFEDDGGISSDEDDNDSDEDDDDDIPHLSRLYIPPPVIHVNDKSPGPDQYNTPGTARPSPIVESTTPTPITPTASRSKLPKLFIRKPPLSRRPSYEGVPTPTSHALDLTLPSVSVPPPPATATGSVSPVTLPSPIHQFGHRRSASAGSIPTLSTTAKKRFKRSWAMSKRPDYNFSAANDIVGIVMLEIQGATDLPKLKNSK